MPDPTHAGPPRDTLGLANRIYRGSLIGSSLLTGTWLLLMLLQPESGGILGSRAVDAASLRRVVFGFLFFNVLWGWLWYGAKRALLRRAGFSDEELRLVFSSRMNQPFDLQSILAGRSERKIRVFDMIGRRGRFITIGLAGYLYVYARVASDPRPEFLTFGLQESLLDAAFASWLHLAAFRSDGFLGHVVFGAQTRVMDGRLGRANCLLITMLWCLFRFVMLPLSIALAARYPPYTFSALFALIWLSYIVCDAASEIFGSLLGRQTLRVWGVGDVNRKSVAGTCAGFLASLGLCLWLVGLYSLPDAWLGLAVAISVSNTLLELLSPRGTDDFTMATANALLCLLFGTWMY